MMKKPLALFGLLKYRKPLLAFLEQKGALSALKAGVLVAFSGGADSVFLLSLLSLLSKDMGFSLSALHVNHHIRGAEAEQDAAFCRSFCEEIGIPFLLADVDVVKEAKRSKRGLEETARTLRYRALIAAADEHGYPFIATAHNATDHAETLLLHLLRGGGSRSLCGISALRGRLLRPLLFLSGEEIRRALTEADIPFVIDSTNKDTAYTRNYLRAEVLPLLRHLSPRLEESLLRLSDAVFADVAYLDKLTEEAMSEARLDGGLSADWLRRAPVPIRRRALITAFEEVRDPSDASLALEHTHILKLEELLDSKKPSFSLSLPARLFASLSGGVFRFLPESPQKEELPVFFLDKGETLYNGLRFFVEEEGDTLSVFCYSNLHKIDTKISLSSATIKGRLTVRGYREKDTIRYGGHTHAVRKWMNEKKIPPLLRGNYPLVCDENGILWIPGGPLREYPSVTCE